MDWYIVWLSFFIGVVSTFVFMGIYMFLLDVFGRKSEKLRAQVQNEFEAKLIEHWENNSIQNERKIEVLNDLVQEIHRMK